MDAREWAEKTARQIKEQRERADLESKKRIQDEELRKAHAPEIWQRLKESVTQKVEALNQAMGENVLILQSPDPNQITVKTKSWSHADFKFNSKIYELRCDYQSTTTDFELSVIQSGDVYFCDRQKSPCTIDQIVEQVLGQVIKEIKE